MVVFFLIGMMSPTVAIAYDLPISSPSLICIFQYLYFVEAKYPHRERRDFTASAPYARDNRSRYPAGDDRNAKITRDIDWSSRQPPAGINFAVAQDCISFVENFALSDPIYS